MPLSRPESKKIRQRKTLARHIDSLGIEMSPCSHCERNSRTCRVLPDSGVSDRCSECVGRGLSCDVEGIPVRDWEMLELEEARLRAERQIALQTIAAASARLARLEKQQEFIRKRASDMIRRGLQTLDELDAQEEKEKQEKNEQEAREKESAAAELQVATTSVAEDPFDPGVLLAMESPSFWALLDSSGGIPPTSQGS
jgi:hypothetical protein